MIHQKYSMKNDDGKQKVIIFIETTEGIKLGRYTSIGFNSNFYETKDNIVFLFSLDKKKFIMLKKINCNIFKYWIWTMLLWDI